MRIRSLLSCGLLAAACAPALPPARTPTPAEIQQLRQVAARSGAGESQVALAAALRAAGARDSARRMLERITTSQPRNGAAALYLGLTYEDLGDALRAEESYRRYLAVGRSGALKRRIEDRLGLLERRALDASVATALAQERRLSGQTPEPRTVAVFPFDYAGPDPAYAPLGRALADFLTTDLGQTDRLRPLERSHVQALVDEIKLSGSGLVDPSTAVRSGRLLQASRIVQGRIGGQANALRIAAAVVPVGGANSGQPRPLQVQDAVARVFDMEKDLALQLYQSMGIELTVAERERVTRRATRNLQALLEFGWGLESEDLRRYPEAVTRFGRALQLDPNFQEAARHLRRVRGMAAVASETTDDLAAAGRVELYGRVPVPPLDWPMVNAEPLPLVGLDGVQVLLPDPSTRDPGSEILGEDGLALPGNLVIILRRP